MRASTFTLASDEKEWLIAVIIIHTSEEGGKQGKGARHSPRGPAARMGDNGLSFAMNFAPAFAQSGREREEEEEEEDDVEVAAVVDSYNLDGLLVGDLMGSPHGSSRMRWRTLEG